MTSDNIPNSNPVGNEDSGDESESIPLAQIDTWHPTKKRKSTKMATVQQNAKRLVIKDEDDDEPLALKSPVKAKKPKTKLNGKNGQEKVKKETSQTLDAQLATPTDLIKKEKEEEETYKWWEAKIWMANRNGSLSIMV